jgi:hypothetical protein
MYSLVIIKESIYLDKTNTKSKCIEVCTREACYREWLLDNGFLSYKICSCVSLSKETLLNRWHSQSVLWQRLHQCNKKEWIRLVSSKTWDFGSDNRSLYKGVASLYRGVATRGHFNKWWWFRSCVIN